MGLFYLIGLLTSSIFFCTFVCFHDQKAAGGEIGKREKARLREMQKLKKQKIHEILSAQNAAIDADMVFCWKDCSFCRLDYFKCPEFDIYAIIVMTEQQGKGKAQVSPAADRDICSFCQG